MDNILPLLNSQGKILYVLSSGPKSSGELLRLTGLSPSTLYYNLKELMIKGLVAKVRGGRYTITREGLRILNRLIEAFSQRIATTTQG